MDRIKVIRTNSVFIKHSVPPQIVDSDTSSDTVVDERQKLSLRCRASGYPAPTVTWRREDGKELNLGLYGGKKYSGICITFFTGL